LPLAVRTKKQNFGRLSHVMMNFILFPFGW